MTGSAVNYPKQALSDSIFSTFYILYVILVSISNSFLLFFYFLFILLQSACRAAGAHCKGKGENIAKIALQYSLLNKEISSVLVGMNSVRQVCFLHKV